MNEKKVENAELNPVEGGVLIAVENLPVGRQTYSYTHALEAAKDYFNGEELPAKVFVDKYALKDLQGKYYENTPDQMHWRLAKEFGRVERNFQGTKLNGTDTSKLSEYGKTRDVLSVQKIYELFKDFKYVIPQGSVMSMLGNPYQIGSLSNCFVLPELYDSYGGILHADQQLIQLAKRRGGIGIDISNLRPDSTPVSNAAGSSTGAVSFMERFSNSCREVAQKGRRGALMLSCDIAHPDIEKFITIKQDLTKVTGANISVRISDDFMKAVKEDKEYTHKWPINSENPSITKTVKARDLWNILVSEARNNAEPGILFWDKLHWYSTSSVYPQFKNISTNPCLTKDTWVMTNEGPKEISELIGVPFVSVLSGKESVSTDEGFFCTGKKKVFKLKTRNGYEIKATENHPFRKANEINEKDVKSEMIELKDIKLGDFVCLANDSHIEWDGTDNKIGELLGSLLLAEYGYAKDKKLRKEIEKTSSRFYRGFLSGWFDADGTVQVDMKKGVSVRLASSILSNLKVAQRMLARLGIISKICENIKPEGWYDMPDGKGGLKSVFCNAEHELTITNDNIKEFYHEVGFSEEAKQEKIKYAIDQHSSGFYRERFVDVVTEIIEIGEEEVFDCNVLPDHEFEANGFLVHNCGEIAMGQDSCRLIAMNMYSFVVDPFSKESYFDFDKFYEVTYESQRLMDDMVELELEAIERIISKIKSDPEPDFIKQSELDMWHSFYQAGKAGRRTGLGFTALADTLAALNLKFDSKEAMDILDKIMRTKLKGEFDSSIDMSIERGSFEGFDVKVEQTSEFVQMMRDEFNDVYARMLAYGRRNVSISTCAPTGSVSILADTSSGIEPVFMLSYKRRKKINPSEKDAKVDYTDAMGDKWQEFVVYHPKLKRWMEVTGETDETKSPYAGSTAPEIDWIKRVEMQSIIQKYTTHSLSSTLNLPSDVTVEQVGEIYLKSWEMGLKGVTVYRDGSRSGVLVSNETPKESTNPNILYETHAPKRPKSLDCDVIRFTNKGEKWIGFVGLFEGRPYEVFTGKADDMKIPYYVETGKIRKTKVNDESKYDFVYVDKDNNGVVEEWLNRAFDKHFFSYAKLISGILRHGMPLPYVVDLINSLKLDDDVITTWKSGVSRMIKKYIPDGTVAGDKVCKSCKSESVIYQEGCLICQSCGSSKCS